MNDLIERLRLGDGTSPDHLLLLESADALEKSVECMCGICKLGPTAAQPTQEPVKLVEYNCPCGRVMKFESEHGVVAPQRTWIVLTDEELLDIYNQTDWNVNENWNYERAIEAKLRSKNT